MPAELRSEHPPPRHVRGSELRGGGGSGEGLACTPETAAYDPAQHEPQNLLNPLSRGFFESLIGLWGAKNKAKAIPERERVCSPSVLIPHSHLWKVRPRVQQQRFCARENRAARACGGRGRNADARGRWRRSRGAAPAPRGAPQLRGGTRCPWGAAAFPSSPGYRAHPGCALPFPVWCVVTTTISGRPSRTRLSSAGCSGEGGVRRRQTRPPAVATSPRRWW